MKRPSFQFYPADWRNNAKLRRCSWAARGVWIELLGLMHDSDEYGLLRWPLKQIAQALGCPVKHLQELVDCGVLYGCERGECEPLVYTPRSGRRDGSPVVLVPVQSGPIWYSPRMVRDEYVRTIRGESSRFGEDGKPSPKGGLGAGNGATPKPGRSDGSTSSSSSSSTTAANAASVDARQKFEMLEHWQPDEVNLTAQLRMQGVSAEVITPDFVTDFIAYWSTKSVADTQGGWCNRLVKRAKSQTVQDAASGTGGSNWAARGVVL